MTRKIITRILKILGIAVVVAAIAIAVTFFINRHNKYQQLDSIGQIAQTAVGPIQYSLVGDDGPVILFAHGTPGGLDQSPLFSPESRPGYRRLTPSRPGYLSTPLEVGRTPAEQAKAFAALLDTLGIDEVIVMGVSGGGPSAVAFAAMYPERTKALIGLEILTQAKDEELEIPAMMKSDFLFWLGISAVSHLDGGKAVVNMLPPDDAKSVLASPDGLERAREWIWSSWPIQGRLPGWENDSAQFMTMSLPIDAIHVPTLLLQGTDDRQVDYSDIERLATRIPNAKLHTVEGGTHAMILSHKDELDSAIDAFLKEVFSGQKNSGSAD